MCVRAVCVCVCDLRVGHHHGEQLAEAVRVGRRVVGGHKRLDVSSLRRDQPIVVPAEERAEVAALVLLPRSRVVVFHFRSFFGFEDVDEVLPPDRPLEEPTCERKTE